MGVPTPAPTPTTGPSRGGILIASSLTDLENLSPIESKSGALFFGFWGNVYNGLVQYGWEDPVSEISPDLATRWELSSDGTEWTFHLRDDVKWHDGQPFTAEDAAFTLRIMKEKAGTPVVRGGLSSVAEAQALDAHTLRVALSGIDQSFLSVLALGVFPVVAEHVYDQAGGDLSDGPNIGTGPFLEGTYSRGRSIEFTRNPEYFEEGLPYLDGLQALIIKDEGTTLAAFRTGRIHVLGLTPSTAIDPVKLEALKSDIPGLNENPWEIMQAKIMAMNTTIKPWDDVRVRRAAFLAMDRWAALKALPDTFKPAGPIFPTNWLLPDEEILSLPGYRQGAAKEQDREEARRLLAEAGFPDGFETTSSAIATIDTLVNLNTYVVDQLAQVGIRVKSELLQIPEWLEKRSGETFEIIPVESNVAFPDPNSAQQNVLAVKPFRYSNAEDAEVVRLWEQQQAELDPAKRREIVFELQRRLIEVANLIPIAWNQKFAPTQPEVNGWQPGLGVWARYKVDHAWIEN